jgi:hypothetical protein
MGADKTPAAQGKQLMIGRIIFNKMFATFKKQKAGQAG